MFSRALQRYAGGAERVEVRPGAVRDVIRELIERFPELEPQLSGRIAVSIDGEIINDPLLEAVEPGSELHFLAPISGG